MSIEAINWALNLKLKPTQKLVVIVLANYANDKAQCWPSFKTLSDKTSLTKRSVIQQIEQLEKLGILTCIKKGEARTNSSNTYQLNTKASELNSLGASEQRSLGLVNNVHQASERHAQPSEQRSPDLVNDVHPNHHITIIEPSDILCPVVQKLNNEDGAHLSEFPDENKPDRNLRSDAKEVLEFLNLKTGHHYRQAESTMKLIIARLKSDVTVAQCKQVIAKKTREWNTDEKMQSYLRPKTLFNATNFETYLGQLGVTNNENK